MPRNTKVGIERIQQTMQYLLQMMDEKNSKVREEKHNFVCTKLKRVLGELSRLLDEYGQEKQERGKPEKRVRDEVLLRPLERAICTFDVKSVERLLSQYSAGELNKMRTRVSQKPLLWLALFGQYNTYNLYPPNDPGFKDVDQWRQCKTLFELLLRAGCSPNVFLKNGHCLFEEVRDFLHIAPVFFFNRSMRWLRERGMLPIYGDELRALCLPLSQLIKRSVERKRDIWNQSKGWKDILMWSNRHMPFGLCVHLKAMPGIKDVQSSVEDMVDNTVSFFNRLHRVVVRRFCLTHVNQCPSNYISTTLKFIGWQTDQYASVHTRIDVLATALEVERKDFAFLRHLEDTAVTDIATMRPVLKNSDASTEDTTPVKP